MGVLAHEFSHVGRRHVAKSLEKEKYISWGSVATMLLALLAPSPAAKAALMAGGMGAGQSSRSNIPGRMKEEADKFGVATAEKAGYNGAGSAEFLRKMASCRSREDSAPVSAYPPLLRRQGGQDTADGDDP